jgi:hypothetical protein
MPQLRTGCARGLDRQCRLRSAQAARGDPAVCNCRYQRRCRPATTMRQPGPQQEPARKAPIKPSNACRSTCAGRTQSDGSGVDRLFRGPCTTILCRDGYVIIVRLLLSCRRPPAARRRTVHTLGVRSMRRPDQLSHEQLTAQLDAQMPSIGKAGLAAIDRDRSHSFTVPASSESGSTRFPCRASRPSDLGVWEVESEEPRVLVIDN